MKHVLKANDVVNSKCHCW